MLGKHRAHSGGDGKDGSFPAAHPNPTSTFGFRRRATHNPSEAHPPSPRSGSANRPNPLQRTGPFETGSPLTVPERDPSRGSQRSAPARAPHLPLLPGLLCHGLRRPAAPLAVTDAKLPAPSSDLLTAPRIEEPFLLPGGGEQRAPSGDVSSAARRA